jgi:diguanylate cyclase (GGDEF)-like protein
LERSEYETTRAVARRRDDKREPNERPYLIGIAGEHAGRLLPLEGLTELIFGRSPDCEIAISLDDDVSRRHARLSIDEAGRAWLSDLGSKNGTLVNGREVSRPTLLRRGDRLFLGDATIFKLDWLSDEEMARWQSASVDALTECYNRAFLDAQIEELFSLAKSRDRPLSVIMLDVDHFKAINDKHLHQGGDFALKRVAAAIGAELEKAGADPLAFRYGGEEFCVLLPGFDTAAGRVVAEGIRAAIEAMHLEFKGATLRITISGGVATLGPTDYDGPASLLEAADARLYRAKAEGRNRIVS